MKLENVSSVTVQYKTCLPVVKPAAEKMFTFLYVTDTFTCLRVTPCWHSYNTCGVAFILHFNNLTSISGVRVDGGEVTGEDNGSNLLFNICEFDAAATPAVLDETGCF